MDKRIIILSLLVLGLTFFTVAFPVWFYSQDNPTAVLGSRSNFKGVGLGWNFYGRSNLRDIKKLGVTVVYDWSFSPEFYDLFAQIGVEYLPMLPSEINRNERKTIKQFTEEHPEARYLLFNEPANQAQNNPPITPGEAVGTVDYYISLVGKNKIILGNVVALDDAWHWLRKFIRAYKNSHNDKTPAVLGYGGHAYYEDCVHLGKCPSEWDPDAYTKWLQSFKNKVKRWNSSAQVWFTEFGTLNRNLYGGIPVAKLMGTAVNWFEEAGTPYFWYATRSDGPGCLDCCCSLLKYPGGGLTWFGDYYSNLPR
jgi:hypothetical protein